MNYFIRFGLKHVPALNIPVRLCELVVTPDREGAGGLTPGHDKTIELLWNNLTARGKEKLFEQFPAKGRQYLSVEMTACRQDRILFNKNLKILIKTYHNKKFYFLF